MNKMISALLSVTILFATAGNVTAQGGDKDIAFIPAKNHAAYVSFITQNGYTDESASVTAGDNSITDAKAKAAKASLKAAKANDKALKNFSNNYKDNAGEARWSTSNDAMVASFSKENVKTNVVYNKRGNWLHTLTYYPESKTPADIATMIDIAYPKDDIRLTVKVEEGGIQFYIVQLEGKTTLKKVTVYNGEVNLIEEHTKSN